MRALRRMLRVDLHRSIVSPRFLFACILTLAWLTVNASDYVLKDTFLDISPMALVLNAATISTYHFGDLIFAISAVTYAWSYCQDAESGFFLQAVQRVGLGRYCLARILTVCISAILTAFTAMTVFVLYLLTLNLPPEDAFILEGGQAFLTIAGRYGFIPYFLVRLTVTGLTCALAAMFGLMVSSFISNVYLAILSPISALYIFKIIFNILGIRDNKWYLNIVAFGQAFPDDWKSFLWAVCYLLILIVACGCVFYRRLQKEGT